MGNSDPAVVRSNEWVVMESGGDPAVMVRQHAKLGKACGSSGLGSNPCSAPSH